jgi:6-phosphogluconolactonase
MSEQRHAIRADNGDMPAEGVDVRILQTAEALANATAEWLCALAETSVGAFAICLAGGSTPRPVYERLATPAFAARFPWRRVHWFWGDERCVPHDHPDSNYRMVQEALLCQVPVPATNIHAIPTQPLTPEQSALAYEGTLKQFYRTDAINPKRPLFDVTLLGIGDDGHTASLFPGQPALQERRRWAVAVVGARSEPRVTLTYPALDSSAHVAFLAIGAGKREAVARAMAGNKQTPAALVRPIGQLHWFIDRTAAPSGAR